MVRDWYERDLGGARARPAGAPGAAADAAAPAPARPRKAIASFLRPVAALDLSPAPGAAAAPIAEGRLSRDLPLERQKRTNWCWAAIGAALARHFGDGEASQCAVVQKTLAPPGVDCCATPEARECNRVERISKVLAALGIARLADPPQPQAGLALADIQADIARDRPVICAMTGGGCHHFVLIVGWAMIGDMPFVMIDDPAVGGRKERPLAGFLADHDGRSWTQATRLA